MNLLDFHTGSAGEFDRRMRSLRDVDLGLPTPCSEWDVRALVNHVVYEVKWAPPLLAGEHYSADNDRFAGDVLGSDAPGAWAAALAEDLRAVGAPGALEGEVTLSYGRTPAAGYVAELSVDLLIHAWDLARAIGADDALDPDLVAHCYEMSKPREQEMKRSGLFGEFVTPPADADPQTRLLAVFGRRP